MKKSILLLAACSISAGVHAQLVDDFSGSLSSYSLARVLDNDTTANVSFGNSGGALQATATTTSQAEQVLFLRNDYSLNIGYRLVADVSWTLAGSQDFGIAIASTDTPTAVGSGVTGDVRSGLSYIIAGIRSSADHVIGTGFDGANGGYSINPQQQPGGAINTLRLAITRTSATDFDISYDQGGGLTLLRTLSSSNPDIGDAIGFYADMRAGGTIGTFDNLRIEAVPEPSVLALVGLSGMGAMLFRRNKAARC